MAKIWLSCVTPSLSIHLSVETWATSVSGLLSTKCCGKCSGACVLSSEGVYGRGVQMCKCWRRDCCISCFLRIFRTLLHVVLYNWHFHLWQLRSLLFPPCPLRHLLFVNIWRRTNFCGVRGYFLAILSVLPLIISNVDHRVLGFILPTFYHLLQCEWYLPLEIGPKTYPGSPRTF